jgi:hypothetical protein
MQLVSCKNTRTVLGPNELISQNHKSAQWRRQMPEPDEKALVA